MLIKIPGVPLVKRELAGKRAIFVYRVVGISGINEKLIRKK